MLPEARDPLLDSDDEAIAEHACPLCERRAATRVDLRCHVETTHRKSELVTELLRNADTTGASPSPSPSGSSPPAPSPSD
ncbi:MAG: hypothetical protein ABEJ05_04765 [Haloglomus sp.]